MDQGNTPFTAGSFEELSYGYTKANFGQGNISNFGNDNDWWSLKAKKGRTYDFTLAFNGIADDYVKPQLKLRGFAGQLIQDFSTSDYGVTEITGSWTSTSSSTQYLDVSTTWTEDDPNYTLTVIEADQKPEVVEPPVAPVAPTNPEGDTPPGPTKPGGTTIIIEGDNEGDIIVGDNNAQGENNIVGDNNVNNGVSVDYGRRWDTLTGNDNNNVIGHEPGIDRMKMLGAGGEDTFVLGDYTAKRKLSQVVQDFNDDIIGFDLTSLGLEAALLTEASTRREFKQATRSESTIIMYKNSFYSDLNAEARGLGGGERFAKVQGDDIALTDIMLTEV